MLSDEVAERINSRRRALGWNRGRLAEECTKLGAPELTVDALTNIESGRRQDGVRRRLITIDELVVIAEALSVRPSWLLPSLEPVRAAELRDIICRAQAVLSEGSAPPG